MKKNAECSPSQWELPSTIQAAEALCVELLETARQRGFEEEDIFAIHLALEEAFVNAVQHGNGSDPTKKIFVQCVVSGEVFEITITDQGPGFCLSDLPDPRCPENLCKSSGRGVLLIQAYMDQVEYNRQGNQVHMVKFKGRREPSIESASKSCS